MMQAFNVLKYVEGQHYNSHYDVFDPESYGPQSSQRVRAQSQSPDILAPTPRIPAKRPQSSPVLIIFLLLGCDVRLSALRSFT